MIIRKIRLTEYEYQPPINYVAGATEPDIQFQLADYTIPAGATARCYVQRFDGTFEYTVATIDGNNVTVEPTSSMFSVRGEGAIQITLYAGEEVLKNFSVPVFVHADLANENAEQGSDVTGIFRAAEEQALGDFQEAAEAKAAEVIESIPADYTELTEEVDELNERLGEVEPVANKAAIVRPVVDSGDYYVCDENGNVLYYLTGGHIVAKNFDSRNVPSGEEFEEIAEIVAKLDATGALTKTTTAELNGIDITDNSGNVIARFADGHIQTKYFDSSRSDQNAVKTVNNTAPDANGNVNVRAELDPEEIEEAVSDYLDEHPVVAAAAGIVSVADYGAVGDGVTDDSAAIQDAVDSNYDVYFESNKTYYLASAVIIDHDVKLHGGENTIIKTVTPSGGTVNNAFVISGTLKKTTTLTGDYTTSGTTDNAGNMLTLSDMTGINIGDLLLVKATDQYYSLARQYYYLGATLLVTDVYNGHIFINAAIPWNITNTANVSVEVYDAPTAIIENLHFVSDLNSRGSYRYAINLQHTKNSVIRGCSVTEYDNCIQVGVSVNALIECVSMSRSKYDNALSGDGYGIVVSSSTNTVIKRVIAMCGQHCVTTTGQTPNIDTFIKECHMSSECRMTAIQNHENAYNTVIEDCSVSGIGLDGTAIINRCHIFRGRRTESLSGILLYGSDKPQYALFKIMDSVLDDGLCITVAPPGPQNPIRAFDCIIGCVEISNVDGGYISVENSSSASILSQTVNRLVIKNWKNCVKFKHDPSVKMQYVEIVDSTFIDAKWIMESNTVEGFSGIRCLRKMSQNPRYDRFYVDLQKDGGKFFLPENTPITFQSTDANGHYVVCGENVASDDSDDYSIGNVSGNAGSALSRTVDSDFNNALTSSGGNLIFTQPNNTNSRSIYPKCMFYVDEVSTIKMSCKLKNTGNTSGAEFRPMIVFVDCATGLVTYRGSGTSKAATAEGVTITHERQAPANSIAMCYVYSNGAVANSETTFEEFVVEAMPKDFVTDLVYEQYEGSNLDGNGILNSIGGMNYIMATPAAYSAKLSVNLEV